MLDPTDLPHGLPWLGPPVGFALIAARGWQRRVPRLSPGHRRARGTLEIVVAAAAAKAKSSSRLLERVTSPIDNERIMTSLPSDPPRPHSGGYSSK